ncbi:Gfo/Idh/MocA family protein [Parachryseolinea silvisoli]|uniref:Gfo/Idh/MocA family protein n=1 Tax=Parachryseolinea silvisoli TaxID=2873601 RepID=UPI002265DA92|nr:Gfo/Idh/MocA family oxidoreductase [Parachryseolinea silvisoli]MCD9017444.1 Gfo/Idh/MocA family oxidoreductase [Parachryseolinea silvisoli]
MEEKKITREKIRWGILGCGKIAHKFANDLKLVDDAALAAVAARDDVRARTFAQTYGATDVHTTYEALASSPAVDVIYIATPHGFHYEHAMLCLQHGKAVLCEKAFALNRAQAQRMIDYARAHGVFLMEAFWTKFLPQYSKVLEIINSGVLGEIQWIQAAFGFRPQPPVAARIYDPTLGGGSLLDVGIYPVFLAQAILGKPVAIQAMARLHATGVDEQCIISLKFAQGALASLSSSFAAETPVEAVIAGTEGRLLLKNRFHNAVSTLEIAMGKEDPQPVEVYRETGYGYQFEARHVNQCLRQGLVESPVMTHADSLALLETLDAIRQVAGIRYAVDAG